MSAETSSSSTDSQSTALSSAQRERVIALVGADVFELDVAALTQAHSDFRNGLDALARDFAEATSVKAATETGEADGDE